MDSVNVILTGLVTPIAQFSPAPVIATVPMVSVMDHMPTNVTNVPYILTVTTMDVASVTISGVDQHVISTKDTVTAHVIAALDQTKMTVHHVQDLETLTHHQLDVVTVMPTTVAVTVQPSSECVM